MVKYITTLGKNYIASYAGLPMACWQHIGLTFLNDISSGICFFLSLYFVNQLGLQVTLSGLIISCYGLGTVLGGVIGGKLSDKYSPSLVSIISLFIKALTFIGLAIFSSMFLLMLAMLLLGITSYSFKTSNNVWILNQCRYQESEKLKAINIIFTASNLGIGLSALLIALLANIGFHSIFLGTSILLFGATFYLIWIKRTCTTNLNNLADLSTASTEEVIATNEKSNIVLWTILSCVFLISLIFAQLSATYSLYIENRFPSMGINAISILFIMNCLLIIFFQTPLVNAFARYNKMLIAGIGAFFLCFGMFMLSFSYVFTLAIIANVVYTFGEMLFIAMAQLICYQLGATKKKGQSLGLYQTIFAIGIVMGPFLGSLVYQNISSNAVWYICGAIGIICLISCSLCKDKYLN